MYYIIVNVMLEFQHKFTMLSFLPAFSPTSALHITRIYYHLNNFTAFMINNIILMFLCYSLKQLLNNVVFTALIISSALKCFINFSKYMITIV